MQLVNLGVLYLAERRIGLFIISIIVPRDAIGYSQDHDKDANEVHRVHSKEVMAKEGIQANSINELGLGLFVSPTSRDFAHPNYIMYKQPRERRQHPQTFRRRHGGKDIMAPPFFLSSPGDQNLTPT